jgi:hypothetical protein
LRVPVAGAHGRGDGLARLTEKHAQHALGYPLARFEHPRQLSVIGAQSLPKDQPFSIYDLDLQKDLSGPEFEQNAPPLP